MTDGEAPWAFIAYKGNIFGGVATPLIGPKSLKRFLGDFAASGYSIRTVHNREEYFEALKDYPEMPPARKGVSK